MARFNITFVELEDIKLYKVSSVTILMLNITTYYIVLGIFYNNQQNWSHANDFHVSCGSVPKGFTKDTGTNFLTANVL